MMQDNVGGDDSFTPICAFNADYALHTEVSTSDDGTETVIGTAAFKMDLVFVTKTNWFNETSGSPNFRRRLKTCSQKGQQECCVADAFNGLSKDEKKQKKKWCKNLGCNNFNCPSKKKRPRRQLRQGVDHVHSMRHLRSVHVTRSMIQEDLYGIEFNVALTQYTNNLQPNTTGAVLVENTTNIEDLAVCRANNYNATEYGTPSLECAQYANNTCEANDYIIVESNETSTNITDSICLPDNFYCTEVSADLCTIDTWDEVENICNSVPVACPHKQSCDPVDG